MADALAHGGRIAAAVTAHAPRSDSAVSEGRWFPGRRHVAADALLGRWNVSRGLASG